jgi:hypothetical protein
MTYKYYKELAEKLKEFSQRTDNHASNYVPIEQPDISELIRNQCDGCARGLPLKNGVHKGESVWDLIGCTKDRYEVDDNENV